MRYFLIFFLSLVLSNSFCQFSEYNKWSVDLSIGGTNAVEPYSVGYWSNTVDLIHTSGGIRYMFNNKFGLKLDGGYDLITNDNFGKNGNSLPFKTNYYRTSIQGVLDIGRIFTFENFTDKWSLLFHTGGGMSLTSSKINPEKDKMVNFMFGFTPQYKINDRIALNVDASFIWHIYQQFTFDMYNSVINRGFDGFLANATVGVNIYLGKKKQHCDWAYTPCFPDMSYLEVENKKKDSVINNLKIDLSDSDGDGVINYSDDEKDTPLGNKVNCRGVSLKNIDSDGDGVNDLIDECIDIPGKPEFAGCPEDLIVKNDNNGGNGNDNNGGNGNDNNGGNGNDNNGGKGNDNNGGKGNDNNINDVISKEGYSTLGDVNFDFNQSTLKPNFKGMLNEVIYLLKQDNNATILIDGHTDITGEESFNTKLAKLRAEAVKRYLELNGIERNRIIIGSFGESKPKYSNDTPGGRALNRRVEIMIKRD